MVSTRATLGEDLRSLGVGPGMVLEAHASLRAVGPVDPDARALLGALRDVLGPGGTLMMPAHTSELTDPAGWTRPPVPPRTWPERRARMPSFDRQTSPCQNVGFLAELFRQQPGTVRSDHPLVSMCAAGKHADKLVDEQDFHDCLGPRSPVGALYRMRGWVLLVGVGLEANTGLHLAESLAGLPPSREPDRVPIETPHGRVWQQVLMPTRDCTDGWSRLEPALREGGFMREGLVGAAPSRLMPVRPAVDRMTALLRADPHSLDCERPECSSCRYQEGAA